MKDQSIRVGIYRRTGRDDPKADAFGLYHLHDDDKLFSKPTLLCCGGGGTNKTNKDANEFANGYAKLGHALLGFKGAVSKDDPLDIVTAVYPNDSDVLKDDAKQLAVETFKGNSYYNDAAYDFVRDHIDPLLLDENKNPLSITEIKRNLRNINILAHSYGGAFVRQLGNALHARLEELFPREEHEQDIRKAMEQVLVVSGGSAAPLGADTISETGETSSFTTIEILHGHDTASGSRYPKGQEQQKQFIQDMLKENGRADPIFPLVPADPLTVMPMRMARAGKRSWLDKDDDSRHCLVYADKKDGNIPHSNALGMFEEKPRAKKTVRDEHNHDTENYFNFGAGQHGFMLRMAVSSALANGMNNSISNQKPGRFKPLPEPMKLLKCPKQTLYPLAPKEEVVPLTEFAAAINYNNRIAAAMGDRGR